MNRHFAITIIAIFAITFFGCEKDNGTNSNGKVELYLIDSFSRIENSNQIEENSVITKGAPLVRNSDILWYDSAVHTFGLSDRMREAIYNLERSTHGVAFAIKANNDLIYTGYFWPSYSSATCDCIAMDPLQLGLGNRIQVRLGYPGFIGEWDIPDKRNDPRLISIFKQDKKLK